MGQICGSICCCFQQKAKPKPEPGDDKSWKDQENISPSAIPDSQLTEEFKVPDQRFPGFSDVFVLRGYDFKNKEYLAKGGFATVFKIRRNKDKKIFALKEIPLKEDSESKRDPKKFKNLKNEIFVIFKIKHKNIVELYDHFIINNICYLVLEFANSGTVEEEVKKLGSISEIKAKTYFIQIVRALEHLHHHSPPIAHRDLKLLNILVHIENNEKILKVTDFGLSKVLTEKTDKKVFRAKYAVGTKPYMSPQMLNLILHRMIIDPKVKEAMKQMSIKVKNVNPIKADIWSLGICLYVMVSGKEPFVVHENLLDTVKEQMNRKRLPIDKNISLQLNDILNRMLEPSTTTRIDISGVVQHKWLSGVSEVIKIKDNKTVKTFKTLKVNQ